jgi:hypothetical protein
VTATVSEFSGDGATGTFTITQTGGIGPVAMLPETPATIALPAAATFILGAAIFFRRRRRLRTADHD